MGLEPDGAKPGLSGGGMPQTGEGNASQIVGFTLRQAARTRNFWLFAFVSLLSAFCFNMITIHIIPHATDIRIPAFQAATIISVLGVCNIAGQLLLGRISDSFGKKRIAVFCSILGAASMIWLIWAREMSALYIFAGVFGFFIGGLNITIAALTGDTFGLQNIGSIIGATQTTFGIGMMLGPLVGGLVFDNTGSYLIAFGAGAVAMLVITLLVILTRQEKIRTEDGISKLS